MGLQAAGIDFKITRNGTVVGKGSTLSNDPQEQRKALLAAVEQYTQTEQFEKDTDRLGGEFSIRVDYLVNTVMPGISY
jgi:pyridoxal biosynthesis lyase PdxS